MVTQRKPRAPKAPPPPVYTYRGGQKIPLSKRKDRFVVRALDGAIAALDVRAQERVSSSSTQVKVRPAELEAKMAAARRIAPTHHAYELADTATPFLITDRVMVRFKPQASPADIDALAGRYGLVQREQFSPLEYLFQLTDHTGMNPVKLVVALTEKEPLVELAENDLNQRMQRRQVVPPADTHYLRAWHLHTRMNHAEVDARSSSRCEQAWQLLDGFGSPDVVIAITDDGCRLDHPDFSDGKFAGWGYFQGTRLVTSADPDALPASMYQTGANHGTSCAGVAAGEADGVMTVGAAPACRLLPVKWESDDRSLFVSDSKLRRVLDWIADKADVMSNSWGIVPNNLFAMIVTDRIRALSATGGRRGRGILFLWAAGNENCPIEHSGNLDIPYTDGWEVDASGRPKWVGPRTAKRFRNTLVGLPGVMHIAALASTAQRSHYSNYGTGIDLTAPSSNSHAYWRMTVPGLGVVAPTGEGQRFTLAFGGTSSATPLVAGIAALVISANPMLTAGEVASVLRRTASKNLDPAPYVRTPPASFDTDTSWDISPAAPFDQGGFAGPQDPDGSWSPWFGFGKADAEAAVSEAMALRIVPEPEPRDGQAAESQRVIDIPDNDPRGIEDTLQLGGTGEMGELEVSVRIRHSYIGDLSVSLVAPDGRSALLHDRNGAGQRDLSRRWTSSDTPALAALRGVAIAGDWRLRISDRAAADTGQLQQWSIAATPRATTQIELAESPGLPIPDNASAGLTRELVTSASGQIADIHVDVDITHPYIGDLRVELLAPSGRRVMLHDRAGRTADNLIRSWNGSSAPQLSQFLGEPAAGPWRLIVGDHEAADVGKLNRWRVALTLAGGPA